MLAIYEATRNSDTTEGRGHDVTIGYFTELSDAVRAAKGKSVMGNDGNVYECHVNDSFSEFNERDATKHLVYGYRKDWKGSWSYGYVDNRDAPVNDPYYTEYAKLRKILIKKYGEGFEKI